MKGIVCIISLILFPALVYCGSKNDSLLTKAQLLSETNVDSAFYYSFEAIKIAKNQKNWELAGKIAKTPLYSGNSSLFLTYVSANKGNSFEEKIMILHQQMRYYVAVAADFDKSFQFLIQIRKELEEEKDFVKLMAGILYTEHANKATLEEAEDLVWKGVKWWKTKNKW